MTFALYNTATSSGSIKWSGGNSGMLMDAGYSYLPALSSPVTLSGNPQNYSANNQSTISDTRSASSPLTTSNYGSAKMVVSASTNVLNADSLNSLNQHIGVAFNAGTFLTSATRWRRIPPR